MYEVFYINFGWSSHEIPASLEAALQIARRSGFEAAIRKDGELIGTWSPLWGFTKWKIHAN